MASDALRELVAELRAKAWASTRYKATGPARDHKKHVCWRAADALEAAALPELERLSGGGWILAPTEPTPKMIAAGRVADCNGDDSPERAVYIAMLAAALPALQGVKEPEGWQVVPREPTEDMYSAGWAKANEVAPNELGVITDTACGEIYRAMLRASPGEWSGNLTEALAGLLTFFSPPGEDSQERFERIAAEFYRDTGMLAPGKSEPMECGREGRDEERRNRYDQWVTARVEAARSLLAVETKG